MPRHLAAPLLLPLTLALLLHGAAASAEDASAPQDAEPAGEAVPPEPAPALVAPASLPRPAAPSRSELAAQALQRQVPAHQQLQLEAGDDAFLSLWQPANQAAPAGLVIILPGDGESADWPRAIGPLRRQLPDAGWSTLSLTLPDAPNAGVAPRPVPIVVAPAAPVPEADTSSTEQDVTAPAGEPPVPPQAQPQVVAGVEAMDLASEELAFEERAGIDEAVIDAGQAYRQQVMARIQAAVAYARLQNTREIVLLGHGTGAYWAAHYLREAQPEGIASLLIVAPRTPQDIVPGLEELLVDLRLATGDFYYRTSAEQRSAARERLQAGKRQKHPAYVQVGLQALPADLPAEQEQLVRRVRGWLELSPRASR